MRIAFILLVCIAIAILLYRVIGVRTRATRDGEKPLARWELVSALVVPLVAGVGMLFVTVRGLLKGEIPCGGKGGCAIGVFTRAEHGQAYWVNLGLAALLSGLLLWVAWRSYRRWRADGR